MARFPHLIKCCWHFPLRVGVYFVSAAQFTFGVYCMLVGMNYIVAQDERSPAITYVTWQYVLMGLTGIILAVLLYIGVVRDIHWFLPLWLCLTIVTLCIEFYVEWNSPLIVFVLFMVLAILRYICMAYFMLVVFSYWLEVRNLPKPNGMFQLTTVVSSRSISQFRGSGRSTLEEQSTQHLPTPTLRKSVSQPAATQPVSMSRQSIRDESILEVSSTVVPDGSDTLVSNHRPPPTGPKRRKDNEERPVSTRRSQPISNWIATLLSIFCPPPTGSKRRTVNNETPVSKDQPSQALPIPDSNATLLSISRPPPRGSKRRKVTHEKPATKQRPPPHAMPISESSATLASISRPPTNGSKRRKVNEEKPVSKNRLQPQTTHPAGSSTSMVATARTASKKRRYRKDKTELKRRVPLNIKPDISTPSSSSDVKLKSRSPKSAPPEEPSTSPPSAEKPDAEPTPWTFTFTRCADHEDDAV